MKYFLELSCISYTNPYMKLLVKYYYKSNLRWTSILSKLEKSIKTQEQEVVYFGKIVPSNNTVMWIHNLTLGF